MWRHFPHHTHARCGEISDFSTSVMRRNLKLLDMWKKFRFLHICHVEKFESTPHVEKFQNSPNLSCIEIWKFSTWQIFSPQIYLWDLWQISGMLGACSTYLQSPASIPIQNLNPFAHKVFLALEAKLEKQIIEQNAGVTRQILRPQSRSTAPGGCQEIMIITTWFLKEFSFFQLHKMLPW